MAHNNIVHERPRAHYPQELHSLVLALVVALPACGGHGPVQIDSAFTTTEASAIVGAIDEWCDATDGGVCLEAIIAHRDGDAISLRPGDLPGGEAGREMGRQIMVDVDQLARAFEGDSVSFAYAVKVVAMHEIGHALGLPHAPDGLMQEDVTNAPACIDARTLRAVCLAHDCGPNAKMPVDGETCDHGLGREGGGK